MSLVHGPHALGSHHTPNKPRIAVISYHTSPLAEVGGPEVGGMNVYVRELCQALGSRGFALDVFTRRTSTIAPVIQPFGPNVRVINIQAGPILRVSKADLPAHIDAFVERTAAFADAEGVAYAAVASHYWMSGVAGMDLARLWHVPHAAMFHTLGEVKNRAREAEKEGPQRIRAEHAVVSEVDAIVVASAHEKELLIELYDADPGRIAIIPCGLDLELFTPIDRLLARLQLGWRSDSRIILFVGRIEPLKGLDILVDAAASLRDVRGLHVIVVGGDVESLALIADLRRQALELGIADRVTFAGAVEHAELPLYYSAADVTVVPSFYESFGLVAVESMACRTPVVASRVGGLTSIIDDRVNGFLVAKRTPEAFAEPLRAILEDPALRTSLGDAGRAAVERYRWSSVAADVGALYHSLLATHAETTHPQPSAV